MSCSLFECSSQITYLPFCFAIRSAFHSIELAERALASSQAGKKLTSQFMSIASRTLGFCCLDRRVKTGADRSND